MKRAPHTRTHLQCILMLLLVIALMCALAIPAFAAKADFKMEKKLPQLASTPIPTLIPAWTAPPTLIPAWTAPPTMIPAWTAPPTLIPAWTAPPASASTTTGDDWMKFEQERGFTPTPTPTLTPTPTAPLFGRKPLPTATPTLSDFSSVLKPFPSPTVTPVVTPAPTQSVTATSAPTQSITTPAPTQSVTAASTIVITKHPTGEVVDSGGSATFIAKANNYSYCAWRFISPDGSSEVIFDAASSRFPGLKVTGGNDQTLKLSNIPAEMNGWKAMCLFSDSKGNWVYTNGAAITVKGAPVATPTPTPIQTPAPATPTPTPTPSATSSVAPSATPVGAVESPMLSPSPSPTPEPEDTKNGSSFLVTALLVIIALLLGGGIAAFASLRKHKKAEEERRKRALRRFRCSNCGWSPKSLDDIPYFCPRCGDEFNEEDIRR